MAIKRLFFYMVFLWLGIFSLVACINPSNSNPTNTPSPLSFSVRVIDSLTSIDVERAQVSILINGETTSKFDITDSNGFATFSLKTIRQVKISVSALGYQSKTITTDIDPDDPVVTILLEKISNVTIEPTPTEEIIIRPTSTIFLDDSFTPTSTFTPSLTPTDTPTRTPTPSPTSTDTPSPTPTTPPPPAPLSQQIAYVSEQEGLPKVFIMNDDGSDSRLLIKDMPSSCQPTWSSDGTKLLFVSPCGPRNEKVDIAYPNASIFIANVTPDGIATGSKLLITVVNGAYDSDWGPTGILFTGLGEGKPLVYFSDFEGNERLLSSDLGAGEKLARWVPGTEFILFFRDNPLQLFVGAFAGFSDPITSNQQITHQTNSPLYPSFSPSGDLIAFTSKIETGEDGTINPSWHISVLKWVWDIANPELQQNEKSTRLTNSGLINTDPDWSPNGNWIAFAFYDHTKGSQFDIYKMTKSGGSIQPLTNIIGADDPGDPDEYQPAWRPYP